MLFEMLQYVISNLYDFDDFTQNKIKISMIYFILNQNPSIINKLILHQKQILWFWFYDHGWFSN